MALGVVKLSVPFVVVVVILNVKDFPAGSLPDKVILAGVPKNVVTD